ncbi:ShlB/FhaC/HecB family hemolysin secretion/activation protein [Halomonas getboli]|uniref:ShlB/FhaC/HecB family hemolysin secretion/activation protein n=1 Tax=Halomonas getboli TaxID=2935862 RepID=UPI001FFEB023|nr:POTRA domain-containing protein [Halomonas getboli]MCK2183440.1 ShlB/FhaC/HecB family hemolysin secretion/activation protein [Halomonas getboli]
MTVTLAQADDLPSLINERQPTMTPPVQDVLERQREGGGEVSLPEAAGAIGPDSEVTVSNVQIQGGSVFDLDTLSAPLQPLVGQRVRVAQLIEATEQITQRYQDAGFPLSYAYLPGNNFQNGTLTVVVVEGYIARTEIAVEDAAVAQRVRRLADRMREERPLTRETFERYTALIERIPGARLAVKAPVPRTPSGATTLRVEQRDSDRVDAGLALGGGDENDTQVIGNLAFHSHTPYAETLSFAYLLPVDNDDTFYAAQYRQELGTDGLRLNMSAQRFEGDDEQPVLVEGRPYEVDQEKVRDRYRLGLDYPLLLERRRSWTVDANLEHLDETADYRYRSEMGPELRARQDLRYSTLELGTHYRQGNADRRLEGRAELRQGIDLGGAETTTEIRNVANGVSVDGEGQEELEYTRIELQGRWLEALTPNWRLSTRVAGFWSDDRLPAPERGSYGASRFARAYDDGEAEGERGYAGEVELRYRQALGVSWASHLEPYLVMDGAHTEFNDSALEYDLASVATGFELSNSRLYRVGIEYAYPIGDRPSDLDSREGRVNARLSWDFGG